DGWATQCADCHRAGGIWREGANTKESPSRSLPRSCTPASLDPPLDQLGSPGGPPPHPPTSALLEPEAGTGPNPLLFSPRHPPTGDWTLPQAETLPPPLLSSRVYSHISTSDTPGIPPLRQLPDGEGTLVDVHVPFSTSDLCDWKAHTRGLSADPEEFIGPTKGIFCTRDPTWAGIASLLTTLVMPEAKSSVPFEAREQAGKADDPGSDIRRPGGQAVPESEAGWNPNDPGDGGKGGCFRGLLLKAMKRVSRPPIKWPKFRQVPTGPWGKPSRPSPPRGPQSHPTRPATPTHFVPEAAGLPQAIHKLGPG
uniref:Core shell protein Gag P30 domain-containing protein n=1 Tax=Equus caballus TaxID=9796 RepID=A0A9L0RAU4_HORSE